MPAVALASTLVLVALAAWLSQGTMALSGTGAGPLAVVPVGLGALTVVACLTASVVAIRRAHGSLAPFALAGLLLLPWIPNAPAVFLLWTGPLAVLVWLAIALSATASSALPARAGGMVESMAAKGPVAAFVVACVVFSLSAWGSSSRRPGGDEPHYLIITQSLIKDHDLRIENNHRRGDYREYFGGDLRPDFRVRGRDGEIYSIHSPGVPVLIAPAFALAGYRGVVVFLILFSAAGAALAWHLAWRVTGDRHAAWFGFAAVTLSTTTVFQSFAVFPDGPGAVVVLTGIWALLRAEDEIASGAEDIRPWLLHGAALATLPWMHPRLAITAGCLGGLILLRLAQTRSPMSKAVAFLAVPAVSALAWLAFFIAIYGTPDPSAPFGNEPRSISFVFGGVIGLLFDQRFGLLAYAPVLVCAIAGLVGMLVRGGRRRLGAELLFLMAPYVLVITHVAMWWGGASAPARFMAPLALPLTIPAAWAWQTMTSRTARVTAVAALVLTVFATGALVFVDGGRLAYNVRDSYAYWLDWLTGGADLAHGLPSWWRVNEPYTAWGSRAMNWLLRDLAIWGAALGAAWLGLRALEKTTWVRARGRFLAAAGAAYAVAAMIATASVWTLSGVSGVATLSGQLQLLRRVSSEPRLAAVTVGPVERVSVASIPGRLRIEPPPATEPGAAGRNDRPLFELPAIPAGRYRLQPQGAGEGWLMVGISRDQFALRTQPLGTPPAAIDLDFPVNVRAIVVKGDEQARRGVRGLVVEPVSLVAAGAQVARGVASRAIRYATSDVFFLDDRSFGEPEGFWVGGSRESSVVIQPDVARASVGIRLRNGPVANTVRLAAGAWHDELALAAGEERRVDIPLAGRAAALSLTTSSGFRPSEVDPKSRDNRLLGVWVQPE